MRNSPSGRERAAAARKRKIGVFVVLLAGLGAVWARAALTGSPRSAHGDGDGVPEAAATSADTPTVRTVEVPWPESPGRDPFEVDTSLFQRVAVDEPPVVDETPVDPRPADDATADLETLELQGTFMGEDPVAIVNGARLRIGDTVAGFTVERIEYRRIILSRHGVEHSLGM